MAATLTVDFSVNSTLTPRVVVFATGASSKGRQFPDRARFKKVAVITTTLPGPYDILAAYNALFGPLTANTRVFFRFVPMRTTGTAGPPQTSFQDVT